MRINVFRKNICRIRNLKGPDESGRLKIQMQGVVEYGWKCDNIVKTIDSDSVENNRKNTGLNVNAPYDRITMRVSFVRVLHLSIYFSTIDRKQTKKKIKFTIEIPWRKPSDGWWQNKKKNHPVPDDTVSGRRSAVSSPGRISRCRSYVLFKSSRGINLIRLSVRLPTGGPV